MKLVVASYTALPLDFDSPLCKQAWQGSTAACLQVS